MKHIIPIICFVFFFIIDSHAQVYVSPKYSVDGDINSMTFKGDTLIVGGDFFHIGVYSGCGILFTNGADSPDAGFPKLNGEVYLSTPDGIGGFYIYGRYYRENEPASAATNRIEHILANNSFESGFSLSVDVGVGRVKKILYYQGVLYVASNVINTIDGQSVGNLCGIDLSTKQPLSWIPAITGGNSVDCIAASGSVLYFSGDFTNVGSNTRNGSAAIEINTGTLLPWQPAVTGSFVDARFYRDKIIIGGPFGDGLFDKHTCAIVDTSVGSNVQYLFDANSLYWAAGVDCIALLGDTLFTYSSGTFDTRVTAIDLAHGYNILWKKYFNLTGFGYGMEAVNGSLYVAGTFNQTFVTNQDNSASNFERDITGLISLNTATGNVNSWNANIVGNSNSTNCLSLSGNKLFAGGDFSHVNGFSRRNICMIDTKNDVVLPLSINFDWTNIRSIAISDTTLYVGGNIGYVGGVHYSRPVMAFSANSGAILSWQPALNGTADAIQLTKDKMIIGGDLTEAAGGSGRQKLFAVDKATGTLVNWSPNPDQDVQALHFHNGRLYVGGDFANIGGQTRNHIAAFDSASLQINQWDPNVDNSVYAISSTDSVIWIGGQFFNVGNTSTTLFTGISENTAWVVDTPTTAFAWSVKSLFSKGRYVIAGGGFDLGTGSPCNNLFIYDRLKRKIVDPNNFCLSFETPNGGGIRCMALNGDDLYFGGRTLKVNSKIDAENIGMIQFPSGFFEGNTDSVSYYPKIGGNGGDVTINFYGTFIKPGMHLTLKLSGSPDIVVPDSNITITALNEMMAVVDLRGVSIGDYDVLLRDNSGVEQTFLKGFKVVDYVAPDIVAQIIAPSLIRTGVATSFIIQLWNTGNVDAYGVPVFIFVNGNDTVTFRDSVFSFAGLPLNGLMQTDLQDFNGNTGTTKAYLPLIPKIPVGGNINVPFDLTPNDNGGSHDVQVVPNNPIIPSPSKDDNHDGNIDIPDDCYSNIYSNYIQYISTLPNKTISRLNDLRECGKGMSVSKEIFNKMASKNGMVSYDAAKEFGDMTLSCIAAFAPDYIAEEVSLLKYAFDQLADVVKCKLDPNKKGDKSHSTSRTSIDPNDKIGTGVGNDHWVSGKQALPYGILFENKDSATLPAQTVRIVDTLDKKQLDLSTFKLDFFQFGSHIVNVSAARGLNANYVDLRPAQNLIVELQTTLDLQTGVFIATFRSLDPVTLQPVTDPHIGFLPPNKNTPEGQGSIYYTVEAQAGIANKSTINNRASIYFDANAPIATSTWHNNIDKGLPASQMLALPSETTDTSIQLNWKGNDGESGVELYDIYYSENGGSFQPYVTGLKTNKILFGGQVGSTYSFYSVATDSVGNREIKADKAETTVTIVEKDFLLYPNPAQDRIYIRTRKDLTVEGVELFDAQGRKIPCNVENRGSLKQINLPVNIQKGIYLIKVITSKDTYNSKVLIE